MMNCLLVLLLGYKLDRICSNKKLELGTRTRKIDLLLRNSKHQSWRRLLSDNMLSVEEAVDEIIRTNHPGNEKISSFSANLTASLEQIYGYDQLKTEAESLRRTTYSSDNLTHEKLLLTLWSSLKPDCLLTSRISKQWTEIGFQGSDPMTDFRGMGILALHNLVYFATHYNSLAQQLMKNSYHKEFGYSLAIVAINLTGLTHHLLTSGHLKNHFYNCVPGQPHIDDLHKVFVYLLYEFDKFWFTEKPADVMQFNVIKEKFQKQIIRRLRHKDSTLTFNSATPRGSQSIDLAK